MSAVIEFFEGLVDVIGGMVDFVIGLISDLVYLAQITAKAVASVPTYFSWVPAPVLTLLVTAFAVVVLYKILGREG